VARSARRWLRRRRSSGAVQRQRQGDGAETAAQSEAAEKKPRKAEGSAGRPAKMAYNFRSMPEKPTCRSTEEQVANEN